MVPLLIHVLETHTTIIGLCMHRFLTTVITQRFSPFELERIGRVMVSVLPSSAVDRGFEP
jgi:hypothetical protein